MCGKLGIKPGAQAPEGMGMAGLDVKLFGELAVDGFDDLTHGVLEPCQRWGWLLLITMRRDSRRR